jgi:predicted dehydrogenase
MDLSRRAFLGVSAAMVVGTSGQMDAQEAKLRACVIGDTNGGGYGHSLHKIWNNREDVEVVGLADPDEAGRGKAGEEAKALRLYADYREMLDKEKPDLLAIGPRWSVRHKEYILAAAEHGVHGIVEKPIAPALADADEMIRAIEEKNLRWGIGFNFRATPMIEFTKRAVFEEGLIGEVLEMRGRGKEDARAGGEDLVVLGTHIFDMMRYFAGAPSWCMADITTDGKRSTRNEIHDATEPIGKVVGDRIHASFGFGENITGYFASVKTRDGKGGRWGLDIYGTKGVVTIRQEPGPRVRAWMQPTWDQCESNALWTPLEGAPSMEMENPDANRYASIVNDLICAIKEQRRPKVSLQDGRDALEMVQAVNAAHFAGGRIDMPLTERRHPLA